MELRAKLDGRLRTLKPMSRYATPPKGWIRGIRDALGMTATQLGARIGMKQQSVMDLERSEVAGTIQLNTLRKAAEALDCTLVYAVIPNATLEGAAKQRARSIAVRRRGHVSYSMTLEGQAVELDDWERSIEDYVDNNIRDSELWFDP